MTEPQLCVSVSLSTSTTRQTTSEVYSPEEWKATAESSLAERDRLLGAGVCMIDPSRAAAAADPEEHVIPNGTGIRWVSLPRGATSSAMNNRASRWEMALLRGGLMGMLRPFYAQEKKEITFPGNNGEAVTFRNNPAEGNRATAQFIVEVSGIDIQVKGEEGPGEFRLELPVKVGSTAAVSRALTKMAYLALAVVNPDLAFSQGLDDVRAYLRDDDAPYRPYGECFRPRASPGAEMSFDVLCSSAGQTGLSATHLMSIIRIHHVEYLIPLFGEMPTFPSIEGVTWFEAPVEAHTSKCAVVFRYESIERIR